MDYIHCTVNIDGMLKMSTDELRHVFLEALAELPGLSIVGLQTGKTALSAGPEPRQRRDGEPPDLVVRVNAHGALARLIVEFKASGYPRDVKRAIEQLKLYTNDLNDGAILAMLAAPTITPEGRAMLREAGMGYFDNSGSFLIELPHAYWMISLPRQQPIDRKIRSLFSGKRTQVLQHLLTAPRQQWHVSDLAAVSGVAVGTAHQVLTELEKHMWVTRSGSGPAAVRVVTEPGQLLDAWASAHSLKQYTLSTYYKWAETPENLRQSVASALSAAGCPYAISFETGAVLTAPHLTSVEQMRVIVPKGEEFAKRIAQLGMEPVIDGANVILYATESATPFMLPQDLKGVNVASDVQIYLDLYASPGRAREQAEFLRRERIGF